MQKIQKAGKKDDQMNFKRLAVFTKRMLQRYLFFIFSLFALITGALYAWYGRQDMNPDGISYLDLGDAYFRGDWQGAINGFFSPFYPWILGSFMYLVKPAPFWEFTVVHLANFFTYLFALVCFTFFLSEFIRYYEDLKERHLNDRDAIFPAWAWVILGYALFIWSSLSLITITAVTPDMCVAGFVYLASAALLRIRRKPAGYLIFFFLGLVLGFAYLAKPVMFILAFVFIATALFAMRDKRKIILKSVIALFAFFLVSAPFLFAVSRAKGRPTFGDVGKIGYAMYINKVDVYYWQGEPSGSGLPKHPTRKILDRPLIYEFGTPLNGTCPLWYDLSYWDDGLLARFDLKGQLNILGINCREYYHMFFRDYLLAGILLFSIFIFYFASYRGKSCFRDIAGQWVLLVPAISTMGLYALVHTESRYVAAFIVVLFMGLFAGVRLHDSRESRRLIMAVAVSIFLLNSYSYSIVKLLSPAVFNTMFRGEPELNDAHRQYCQVVDALRSAGIKPRDEVAVLGDPFRAYWARLAKVKIVAAVPLQEDKADFWEADNSVKSRVIETLSKKTTAKIIVASPAYADINGWQRIKGTDYSYYILER